MRIAIEVDASPVARGGTLLVRKQIEEFGRLGQGDTCVVFGWAFKDPAALARQFPVPDKPGFSQEIQRWPQSLVQKLEWDWALPLVETRLKLLGVDVYHCFRVPPGKGPATVMTVPDVWPIPRPEWFKPEHAALWEGRVKPGIARTDAIVTFSEATKRDLVRGLGVQPDKVHITPLGVDHDLFRQVCAPPEIREKYKLPEKFLLMVGPFDVVTNFAGVVEALAGWPSKERPTIVCVGPVDDYVKGLQALAREKGVDSCFRWIGYVPQKELVYLYNLAEALVYPSLLPGVELPPYEALACGLLVLCSLEENIADAGILIDAESPAQIRDAMRRAWESRADADRLRPKALARAKQFTWRRNAETTRAA